MGARVIRKPGRQDSRNGAEFRLLMTILGAIGLPLLLAYLLVAADLRTDLSELKPAQPFPDESTVLIGWRELEKTDRESMTILGRRVRMLGYMMDGYKPSREGDAVDVFILLPEAGQLLHAAHRIPNQMVEIWLTRPASFQYRQLVWVSGVLARVPGRPEPDKAVYALTNATADPAAERDIERWFTP